MSPFQTWSNSVRRYPGEGVTAGGPLGFAQFEIWSKTERSYFGGDKRQHGHACPYIAHETVDWVVLTTPAMSHAHPLPTDGAFSCLTSQCWLAAEELVEVERAPPPLADRWWGYFRSREARLGFWALWSLALFFFPFFLIFIFKGLVVFSFAFKGWRGEKTASRKKQQLKLQEPDLSMRTRPSVGEGCVRSLHARGARIRCLPKSRRAQTLFERVTSLI